MKTISNKEILKLIELAITASETTNYKFFVDYSGHVNFLSVRYREKGQDMTFYKIISLNTEYEQAKKESRNTYKSIIKKLNRILEIKGA